ncbi:hypothetical protein Tco_1340592 [Tanacetum coccineum]
MKKATNFFVERISKSESIGRFLLSKSQTIMLRNVEREVEECRERKWNGRIISQSVQLTKSSNQHPLHGMERVWSSKLLISSRHSLRSRDGCIVIVWGIAPHPAVFLSHQDLFKPIFLHLYYKEGREAGMDALLQRLMEDKALVNNWIGKYQITSYYKRNKAEEEENAAKRREKKRMLEKQVADLRKEKEAVVMTCSMSTKLTGLSS